MLTCSSWLVKDATNSSGPFKRVFQSFIHVFCTSSCFCVNSSESAKGVVLLNQAIIEEEYIFLASFKASLFNFSVSALKLQRIIIHFLTEIMFAIALPLQACF